MDVSRHKIGTRFIKITSYFVCRWEMGGDVCAGGDGVCGDNKQCLNN